LKGRGAGGIEKKEYGREVFLCKRDLSRKEKRGGGQKIPAKKKAFPSRRFPGGIKRRTKEKGKKGKEEKQISIDST